VVGTTYHQSLVPRNLELGEFWCQEYLGAVKGTRRQRL